MCFQGGGMNDEDFSGIEAKALASGAVKSYVLDLQVRKNDAEAASIGLADCGITRRDSW